MATIDFFIPLAEYEKRLIDDFTEVFAWNHNISGAEDILSAVLRYKWTKTFQKHLNEVISESEWREYHKGDWEVMCECLERSLRMEIKDDKLRFRGLIAANRHLSQIQFSPQLQITVKAFLEDYSYWATLSTLIRFYDDSEPAITEPPSELENETARLALKDDTRQNETNTKETQKDEDHQDVADVADSKSIQGNSLDKLKELWEYHSQQRDFEVWSLLRACASILRRDTDSIAKANEAIAMTGFYKLHNAVHNGFVRNEIPTPGTAPHEFGGYRLTAKGLNMVTFGDHPLKYIEFVPWNQLDPFHLLETSEYSRNRQLMLWKPAKYLAWERHMYTEDGIFGTCVLSGIQFPGYLFGGSVIFAISPISTFTFSTNSFWERWNDCSVTHNPQNGDLYLLETLPGLQFRTISKTVDEEAAVQFFRGFVENKIQGRKESLPDVLGLHFQPKYENLLTLIPHSQISKIDPVPLGEGERGVVYRAVWSHQAGFGDNTLVHSDVALKSIKVQGTLDLQRFMKELDSTFSAVSGASTHSITKLHGIVKTPCYRDLDASSPCFALPENRFFLVLDYAIHGGLKQYLLKTLKGTEDDWPILVGFMINIAGGLYRIHKRNVVHRDIHWGNVLVSVRYCLGEIGAVVESIEALISDLGEGQQISTQSHGRTYYGNEGFWAPEVRRDHHHTPASDIYAIGCLFLEMVQLHWDRVQPKEPVSTARKIQVGLLQIILACLATNAEERPKTRELMFELEMIGFPSEDENKRHEEGAEFIAVEPERLRMLLEEWRNSKIVQIEGEEDIVI